VRAALKQARYLACGHISPPSRCRSPEALAKGSPSLHSGGAIAARCAGALLTGLTTALAFGSRRHFMPASLSLPLSGCLLTSASLPTEKPSQETLLRCCSFAGR
jgi:hypothetical protein